MIFLALSILNSCQKKEEASSDPVVQAPPPIPRYLYVATGKCYVGNLVSETPSNTIVKLDLESGSLNSIIMDYNITSQGDSPVALVDLDKDYILALVENTTGGRRIDKISKVFQNNYQSYITNSTAISAVARDMVTTRDGGLLVSKSSAIEKFNSAKARVGTTPYINSPGGSCASSTSLISKVLQIPNGKIIYAHASATANKIGVIAETGYSITSDCLSSVAAPAATAYPTSMVYIPSSKHLLVSYASTTLTSNGIYAYEVDENLGTLSAPVLAYQNNSLLWGISNMTYDEKAGVVFVAIGSTSLANAIEKFTYDATSKSLSRVGTVPYYPISIFNKCITSMFVGE